MTITVELAERAIADILRRLEEATGSYVEDVELRDIEVTTMTDDRPQMLRQVLVNVKRQPGTRWGQAPAGDGDRPFSPWDPDKRAGRA